MCTEKNDTIIGQNICNRMLSDSSGLYILGISSESYKVLYYNFEQDSCSTIKISNGIELTSTITGIVKIYSSNFLFTGFERNSGNSKDIKVFTYNDSMLNSYSEPIVSSRLLISKTVQDIDGNIYFIISNNSKNENEMRTYLVSLDKDLHLRYSTRDTQKEINLTIGNGIHIDSDKNMLVSGYTQDDQGLFIPKIIKLDSLGNLIWITTAGNNSINNDQGWGVWNEIISSHDNQHYIVVGSESYKNTSGDTLIASALVSKLTLEGDLVWSEKYSFREAPNQTICILNDIVKSSDNNYYISGNSMKF
ncbi:MAG: hypothetical protein AAGA77_00250 [Bacteroidota bacterium]